MPQAANLVLKDAAGVDKTFVLAQPASGNSPAIWYLQEGANKTVWPKIEASSAKAGSGNARKVKWTLTVPEAAVDAQGVTRPSAKQFSTMDHTTPDLVSAGVTLDAVAFQKNLSAHALYAESISTGYAPA